MNLDCIAEDKVKTWRVQKANEDKKETKLITSARTEAVKAFPFPVKAKRISRTSSISMAEPEDFPALQKLGFLDAVSISAKMKQKERSLVESLKEMQQKQEKQEAMSHPIKHSDIEVNLADPADRAALENYENEVLGTYKNYKSKDEI